MTREELKEHCQRQIQQFERVEKIMPVTPNDWKRYEEHKLVLELLEQEPRKGHWIDIHEYHYYNDGDIETTELRCSCCNETVEWDIELLHKPYYCENCGADMREVEE